MHLILFATLILNVLFAAFIWKSNERILHVIIQHGCRAGADSFFAKPFNLLIHVHRELKLASVIKVRRIKLLGRRLVIDYPDKDLPVLFCKIHSVNLSTKPEDSFFTGFTIQLYIAPEGDLKSLRLECTLLYLISDG